MKERLPGGSFTQRPDQSYPVGDEGRAGSSGRRREPARHRDPQNARRVGREVVPRGL